MSKRFGQLRPLAFDDTPGLLTSVTAVVAGFLAICVLGLVCDLAKLINNARLTLRRRRVSFNSHPQPD